MVRTVPDGHLLVGRALKKLLNVVFYFSTSLSSVSIFMEGEEKPLHVQNRANEMQYIHVVLQIRQSVTRYDRKWDCAFRVPSF